MQKVEFKIQKAVILLRVEAIPDLFEIGVYLMFKLTMFLTLLRV